MFIWPKVPFGRAEASQLRHDKKEDTLMAVSRVHFKLRRNSQGEAEIQDCSSVATFLDGVDLLGRQCKKAKKPIPWHLLKDGNALLHFVLPSKPARRVSTESFACCMVARVSLCHCAEVQGSCFQHQKINQ